MDLFFICVLCVSVILYRLFLAVIWSPAVTWLSCMFFLVFCHFPISCPGSGVVFDCIDYSSLPFYLLLFVFFTACSYLITGQKFHRAFCL